MLPRMDPPLRDRLAAIPPAERDAWVDGMLELDLPADGALPAGCVPYLPCPIDKLLAIADHVAPDDVFVDVGAGIGRAAVVIHLITGARAVGIEIQPELVRVARALVARTGANVTIVEGDAADAPLDGSFYFLYCPFGGERLARVLARLESIAKTRTIRVCCVDLPLPACPWLARQAEPALGVELYVTARSSRC